LLMLREDKAAGRQIDVLLAPTLLRYLSNGSQGVQVSIGVFLVVSEGMTSKSRLLPR